MERPFRLIGWLEASTEIERFADEIKKVVEEAEQTILKKGVPKGDPGAKVERIEVKGRKIVLEIAGTSKLRPHVALKRLKNVLAAHLGKKYKIGIRDFKIERYVVPVKKPVNEELLTHLKYYDRIEEIRDEGDVVVIVFKDVSEREVDRGDIDRAIRYILPTAVTMRRLIAKKVGTVVKRSAKKEPKFTEDPNEWAVKLGWAVRFPGRAQWIYLPPFARLKRVLAELVLEHVTKPMGFIEVLFPKLIHISVAFKAKKIQGEPGGMYYVCPPRYREKEKYIPLKVKAEITGELPMDELIKLLEEPSYILDPIQCMPFYQLYSNKVLKPEDLPIKVFEFGGPTYRYEAGGTRGIERVDEFWRIEHVWLGTPEQVREIRNEAMERMTHFVDKVLDLEWRLQFAGDTFYLAEDQKIDEDVRIPEDPKYELQIWLPYRGPRESNEKDVWLSVSSFNLHGTHYTKNFNIRLTTGELAETACFGVGVTRLAIAFLAQKGFDPKDWPDEVRERYGKVETLPGFRG